MPCSKRSRAFPLTCSKEALGACAKLVPLSSKAHRKRRRGRGRGNEAPDAVGRGWAVVGDLSLQGNPASSLVYGRGPRGLHGRQKSASQRKSRPSRPISQLVRHVGLSVKSSVGVCEINCVAGPRLPLPCFFGRPRCRKLAVRAKTVLERSLLQAQRHASGSTLGVR